MYAGIILAGETPGSPDPLAVAAGASKKSLIPIAGRPMVSYVYDALAGVARVGPIVIVGLTPDDGLSFSERVALCPPQGGLLDNALAALETVRQRAPDIDYAVLASSDIPLLTSDVVDDYLDLCTQSVHEIYYPIVEKSMMEAAYPGSGRSFRKFGPEYYCGGDLYLVSTRLRAAKVERIRKAVASRKSGLGQAWSIGFVTLLKFALGRLTIQETIRRAGAALGLDGTAIVAPHASLGMDVDKPHQLEMARAILEARRP